MACGQGQARTWPVWDAECVLLGWMIDDSFADFCAWLIAQDRSSFDAVVTNPERYGPKRPKPIQRGIADAAKRLYDEQSVQQFDVPDAVLRFGDVLSWPRSSPLRPTGRAPF